MSEVWFLFVLDLIELCILIGLTHVRNPRDVALRTDVVIIFIVVMQFAIYSRFVA